MFIAGTIFVFFSLTIKRRRKIMSNTDSKKTQDHHTIKNWVQERNGEPCVVADTANDNETGVLRISFGQDDNGLEPISWDKFFEKFDSENLALLYQEENSDGSKSQFNKFISAE